MTNADVQSRSRTTEQDWGLMVDGMSAVFSMCQAVGKGMPMQGRVGSSAFRCYCCFSGRWCGLPGEQKRSSTVHEKPG